MLTIGTDIEIAASPAMIWSILADLPSYGSWNPFITSIKGQLVPDGRITTVLTTPKGTTVTFQPRVLVVEPERELRWRGQLLVPGLFSGEHFFQIEPLGPGRSRFIQGEAFSGILVRVLKSSLEGDTARGFVAMNVALKARAEGRGPTGGDA